MYRLILCSLLAGCNALDTPFKAEFDRGPNVQVVYEYVDHQWQMDTLCGSKAGSIVLGCSRTPQSTDGVCVITLFRNGLDDIKQHEEKHCRYGRWHL